MSNTLVIFDEDILNDYLSYTNFNFLLILFTMGCLSFYICNPRKNLVKNKYILISPEPPDGVDTVKGEIIEKV